MPHAEGEWFWSFDTLRTRVPGGDVRGKIVNLDQYGAYRPKDADANRALIAAAPAMLKMLIECLECEFPVNETDVVHRAEDLIATLTARTHETKEER